MCDPIAPRLLAHRRSPTVAERQYAEWRLRAASSLGFLLVRIDSQVAPIEPNRRTRKYPVLNSVLWLLASPLLDLCMISFSSGFSTRLPFMRGVRDLEE